MSDKTHSDAPALADEIETELRALGSPERAVGQKRYLKSDLEFLGATLPQTRRVARSVSKKRRNPDREALVDLASALWSVIERLIRESQTWALVDRLAISVAGPRVERNPASRTMR